MERKIKRFVVVVVMAVLYFLRTLFLIPRGVCKHTPSCSTYAQDAFMTLPLYKALFVVVKRLLKCNPFSKGGYDPI